MLGMFIFIIFIMPLAFVALASHAFAQALTLQSDVERGKPG